MLLTIQFPLADSRAFIGEGINLLGRPTWPSASPDVDFVRSFGAIRRRKLGGLSNWVGESVLCEANRALRFSGTTIFSDFDARSISRFSPAFKRFYFDGLAVGKYEAGFTASVSHLKRTQTKEFIEKFLNISVLIPSISDKTAADELSDGVIAATLGQAGKYLARAYAASTISYPLPMRLENWWVRAGAPLLFLIHKEREYIEIPFRAKLLPIKIPRSKLFSYSKVSVGALHYCEVPYGGRSLRMWIFRISRNSRYRNVRELKICLLRLHAEQEALRLILQNIATKKIEVLPRSDDSLKLQYYLNKATQRISRLSCKADRLGFNENIVEIAREAEDNISPNERNELLETLKNIDVKRNIYHKVERYVDTIINVNKVDNLIGNIGEVRMDTGNKYNVTADQIGAVGDHAEASGVFNQWNQSGGDLKTLAQELTKLREELGKAAKEPEQFRAAAAVSEAEEAARNNNGSAVFEHLQKAGAWVLEIATKIGVPVAIEALKKATGMG